MNLCTSMKTRNTLTEVEKIIRQVPEVYRKELCLSLKDHFCDPLSFFHPSDCAIVRPFHKATELYHALCDEDKKEFREYFSEIANQFGA